MGDGDTHDPEVRDGDLVLDRSRRLLLALLVCGFVVLGLVQAERDAPAVDEVVDLTAGLVTVERRDIRMNPEHGVVPHVLSALLPSLMANPIVPVTESYEDGDWFDYTNDLIRENDRAGRLDDVLFWFRVAPVLVAAGTGLLLHRLAGALFGGSAGMVAAALWLTTPYVLGLAHIGTLDVWYTAALTLVALAALPAWKSPSTRSAVVLAAAVSLAMLVRHQAVLLVAVAAIVMVVRSRPDRRRAAVAGVVTLLVPVVIVWATYRGLDPVPATGPVRQRFDGLIAVARNQGPLERLAMSLPLPTEWRAGTAYLIVTSEPRPAYLVGQSWSGGRLWYFVGTAVVKLPLSTLLLVIAGLVGWRRVSADRRRLALAVIATAFGAETVLLHVQPLNLGLRLALPLIAVACVVSGPAVVAFRGRTRVVVLSVLGLLQVGAFVTAHPNSLAWTPPPFSDGYRFVSDSSIDLGQGIYELRMRHRRRPLVAASLLTPLGIEPLEGVPDIVDLRPRRLVGDVAASATQLTVQDHDDLSWLRAYCPVEVLADSIVIYRFDHPPDLSPGPSMPRPPCAGPVSTR